MKETTIGIDLGTTFSCVATIDEHGKPIVLKNEDGNTITASVVAFEQDGNVIVGDEAKNIQSLGDANVASFFKREMGKPDFYFTFHGKQYSPTDLSAYVLVNLKASAEKVIGKTVTKAVVTCPAYFNAIQREEVKKAGKIAGLDVLRVINEPTAAAIAFGIKSEKEQTLLVYDLGGGTFDVTLMKITADEIDVLATDGNHQLGGKDWDDALREYAVGQFQEEFAANPLEDSATANDLLVKAEDTKRALSQKTTTNFVIAYNGNKGRYAITREQFEEATKHLINQTLTLCESVLLAAKQTAWKNIDGILLVGGSTRMPQVETELKKRTDKPILHGINVDEAVAIGAAIQADLDSNEKHYTLESKQNIGKGKYTLEGRRTIKDVTGQSLGMIAKNADGSKYINSIIIPRNTNIPSCEVRPYQLKTSPSQDNEIEVYVTQGESPVPNDCAILGKYVVSGITHESDNAICDIEYQFDKNGIVEVAAKQRSTGKKLAVRKDEPGDMSWVGKPVTTGRGMKDAKIVVTSPCYDDIGKVLRLLGRSYDDYTPSTGFECDLFFLNCGTPDSIDQRSLQNFVAKGGILYASDLTSSLVDATFPGIFRFSPGGKVGTVKAFVRDEELKEIIGDSVSVYFDLDDWSILESINQGKIILESAQNRKPLMVQVPFEKGEIFFTCFHNHVQANAREMGVLQLLIAKQFAEFEQTSIPQVLEGLQKNVADFKQLFAK